MDVNILPEDEIQNLMEANLSSSESDKQSKQQDSQQPSHHPTHHHHRKHDNDAQEKIQKYFESLSSVERIKMLKKRKICGLVEGCDTIEGYQKLNRIHEGVYGEVFRARDMLTGEVVAIKKIKFNQHSEKEGFPITSLREFNILLSIYHPNIVQVKRVVVGSQLDKVFMVMEYMEHELKDLIEKSQYQFTIAEVKSLVKQLLQVCDFGLARKYLSQNRPYTQKVVTLWYRAPEILLGQSNYTTQIDIWSAGCIFVELVLKDQLFRGMKELEHIDQIFRVLGTPTDETWPNWKKLPFAAQFNFPKYPGVKLQEVIPQECNLSEAGIDLLKQMLSLDPLKRISAAKALKHPWFTEEPLALPEEQMPTFQPLNEISREDARKKVKPNQ